ncbi:MAG TPA: sugar ABC transporter permease [Kineosporiaceae bacterium]|nr:sugar ABC transporter permease [Kineosporiaceae bacterium]
MPRRRGAAGRGRRDGRHAALFLLPFTVPFVLLYLVPVGYAVQQSLLGTRRTGGLYGHRETVFVGLDQYRRALGDGDFLAGVVRVLLFAAVQIPVMLGLALLLALLLDGAAARWKGLHRLALFLPYGNPGVIAAIMWAYLYDPRLSPVTDVAARVGLHPDFLGSDHVLWAVANVVTWGWTGYNMLILFAALQALPQDLYEAAALDGAGPVRTALQIKVPLIAPAIVLTVVFAVIGTLQLFTEPAVLRTITTSITSSYTPNLSAYSAASANDYPYASAMSVLLALVTCVLSFTVLRLTTRWSGTPA